MLKVGLNRTLQHEAGVGFLVGPRQRVAAVLHLLLNDLPGDFRCR